MKYLAYAKINLRLEIEKKLENGYHLLHMLNAKVNLADELIIEENKDNLVTFSVDELNHLENNICLNVLNEMCNLYNIQKRFHIYIKKNIPFGAGLGGGSSDVAAIINFIDEYFNLNLTLDEKIKIGVKYGADVPYCLINEIAYVSGIGEIICSLKEKLNMNIIIIYPNTFVSTKDVFNNNEMFGHKTNIETLEQYLKEKDYNSLLYNDLENATFKLYPHLCSLKEELRKYGKVIMSGSGSTMLVIPNNENSYNEIKERYPDYIVINSCII